MKASHKRLESDGDGEQGDAKKPGFGNEQPVTPPADDAMLSLGERVPKTPRLHLHVWLPKSPALTCPSMSMRTAQ